MENQINQLQNQIIQSEQEKSLLVQNLTQAEDKIKELAKQVKKLEVELKTEEAANNIMLDKERKEKQALEQQLAQKQTQITNYENQLRAERNQNANLSLELQAKDIKIQELAGQLEVMTKLLEQDLTGQIEFPPKGIL